jgi:hypothetical protein
VQQNESTQEEELEEPSQPTTTPPPPPQTTGVVPTSVDTDSDGLTDTEEQLIGTEVRVADSDGDGFTDGQEVRNLYSPFSAGPIRLDQVASFNIFSNTTFGYSLLTPAAWLVRATDASRREIQMTSVTGEQFFLEVFQNANDLTVTQWLIDNQPEINPGTVTNIATQGGYAGVLSENGLIAYLAIPETSQVLRLQYDPGSVARLNFSAIFEMMLESITFE